MYKVLHKIVILNSKTVSVGNVFIYMLHLKVTKSDISNIHLVFLY